METEEQYIDWEDFLTDDESSSENVIEMEEDVSATEEAERQEELALSFHGVKVDIPVKPYPSQKQMMELIIEGCSTEQNCLLESPTGSGKTLALLCGALAFQTDFQRKFVEAKQLEIQKVANLQRPTATSRPQPPKLNESQMFVNLQKAGTSKIHQSKPNEAQTFVNFQKAGSSKSPKPGNAEASRSEGNEVEIDELDLSMFDVGEWRDDDFADYFPRKQPTKVVPKIYYGSRTHRQISQVIRELKKTVYRNKRMTVLSSRDYSCIQDTTKNKTELCAELLDVTKKKGCPYYNEDNKYDLGSFGGLAQHNVDSPWDIEDLVTAGRAARCCPYFAARSLVQDAEIIFCPYNYLIDPAIRETLQLNVQGHIIILDEAHNIEDFCRGAGSASLPDSLLEKIVNDCRHIIDFAIQSRILEQVAYASMIESYCERLRKFVQATPMNEKASAFDASSKSWTGAQLQEIFEVNGISRSTTTNFLRSVREAILVYNAAKENARQSLQIKVPSLPTETIRKLEMILMGFDMIESPQHAAHYRAVVRAVNIGYSREKSLEFMCMLPGVIFEPLSDYARSIILASGTLAPTSTFAGELSVKFPYMIQAKHVVPQDQVCVKCVSKGPNGTALRAVYHNVKTWEFQDEIGQILLTICRSVPHGVLFFVSSYPLLDSLITRWQSNNKNVDNTTWAVLSRMKKTFRETRGSEDLPRTMMEYREAIENTSNGPVGNLTGAILFAVFRGKVAEGIDFSDNEARAVVTLGIPFAVRTDPTIDMKCQYNDANRGKGLLSGSEWYTVQAFRALNQALGRAIRHQNDWGAIILVDERFLNPSYTNLLPAWVRAMWVQPTGAEPDLAKVLTDFVARQRKR